MKIRKAKKQAKKHFNFYKYSLWLKLLKQKIYIKPKKLIKIQIENCTN